MRDPVGMASGSRGEPSLGQSKGKRICLSKLIWHQGQGLSPELQIIQLAGETMHVNPHYQHRPWCVIREPASLPLALEAPLWLWQGRKDKAG